jgi:phage gp36-like protein
MPRPGRAPGKSLAWHAGNNGENKKMGHLSWSSAYNDGYTNNEIINWINGDPGNRKAFNLYNQAIQLRNVSEQLSGTVDLIYLQQLGREADDGGRLNKMENFERYFIEQGRNNPNLGTATKRDRAYNRMRTGMANSAEGQNTQQVAKNAYETFLGRPWTPADGQAALNQSALEIMKSVEAGQFRQSLESYGKSYGGGGTVKYDSSQAKGYYGNGYQLGLLTKWKQVGRNSNQIIPSQQILQYNPSTKNLEYTKGASKLLGNQARQKYNKIINDFRRSKGGNYKQIMSTFKGLDSVAKAHFNKTDRKATEAYYTQQKIRNPWTYKKNGVKPPTGGFDFNYYMKQGNNNKTLNRQWNAAKNNKIGGYSFADLDITARYANLTTYAQADYSQRVKSEPTLRANAAADIGEYSEAYDDLTDAQQQLYRDELLGLTKKGASGQLSIDYTDDQAENSRFENQVLSNLSGQELLEQDKFGTLTQDSLKFAADKLKEQQENERTLDLYKNLPGFNEIYSANSSLANSLLGDSGIGGYLSMLGKDTEAIQEDLEEQFAGVTGIPSNNSTIFNWQKWFDEEMVKRYDEMETITVEFDDTITDLDLNSETGKIQYEIQLTRMGIDPYDEDGNLIDKSVALETLEANNFQRIYEIDENFKTNFIENYLKPRFDQSKSMDEFISYMDVKEDEQNIFQTQSALDSLKTLASKQSRLLLENIQDLPGDFNYKFYFNPDDENEVKQSTYNIQKRQVTRDWEKAKKKGNSIPPGQVADKNGNNYTWNQWAYFYGLNINNKQEFARLHYKVVGAAKGFDPAADILTQEKVDDYFVDNVVPALNDARLDLDSATFMNFVTPEQFADEVLRGIDPEKDEEAWKKVLDMYGLEGTEAIDEVRNVIIEAVRTGSAQRIRESIKFLNEKKKTPTQKELGVNYIERESDKKFVEDENATELYKVFQNAGYSGTEDEFFDTFMPDADRADLDFIQRGLSGDFELKDINTEDPFEALASVGSFLGDGGNIFGTDSDNENQDKNDTEDSYFNFFDDEDDDYASDTGRSIINGYTDFFK